MVNHLRDLAVLMDLQSTAEGCRGWALRASSRPKRDAAISLATEILGGFLQDLAIQEEKGIPYWQDLDLVVSTAEHFALARQSLNLTSLGEGRERCRDLIVWLRANPSKEQPKSSRALAAELFEFITYFETRLKPVVNQFEEYAHAVFPPGSKELDACLVALQALIQDRNTVTVAINDSGGTGPRADTYLLRNGLAHALWIPDGEVKIKIDLVDHKGKKTIGSATVQNGYLPALISRIQRRFLLLEMWIAINVIVLSLLPLDHKAATKVLHDAIASGALKRQSKRK